MSMDIGAKLVSKLGSTDSRIPLAVKDSFNIAGNTYFAYDAGGSIEAKDKCFDEVGTGAVWLFGIPFFKKIIDKTLYKMAKISPEVDIRVIKDDIYCKTAIQHAPNDEIKNEIEKAKKFLSKTKKLTLAKFALSMGMTMLSYLGLTKLKQKMTKLNIEKEFHEKMKNNPQDFSYIPVKSKSSNKRSIFTAFKTQNCNQQKNVSFTSGKYWKKTEDFIHNPVKNMMLLDLGISYERCANARTDGEFKEYVIKEASFLGFVYGVGEFIKQTLEYSSYHIFKTPVSLDAQFLSSDLPEEILKNPSLQNQVKQFNENFQNKSNTNNMYDYLFKNQDNIIVKSAEKSGIIECVKDKDGKNKIDTRKYIDTEKIQQMAKDIELYIKSGKNAHDLERFIKKIRNIKILITAISTISCCSFLGYKVPKSMFAYRQECQNGNSDFHVKKEYEKELAQRFSRDAA